MGQQGQLTFYNFTNGVMGSSEDSRMSLDTSKNKHTRDHVGNDAGTSDQMIRRKVQMAWKQLRCAFRDIDARGEGWVTKEQLRKILTRYDIDMVDSQFDTMCAVRKPDPKSTFRRRCSFSCCFVSWELCGLRSVFRAKKSWRS